MDLGNGFGFSYAFGAYFDVDQLYDSVLRDGLNDAFSDAHSGWHTEDLAEKCQVTAHDLSPHVR